jgi:hypothetical protein
VLLGSKSIAVTESLPPPARVRLNGTTPLNRTAQWSPGFPVRVQLPSVTPAEVPSDVPPKLLRVASGELRTMVPALEPARIDPALMFIYRVMTGVFWASRESGEAATRRPRARVRRMARRRVSNVIGVLS